jgi:outer membrane lipoprotein-sorting protein
MTDLQRIYPVVIFAFLIILCGFVAGCTNSSSSDAAASPDPIAAATGAPLKDIKDQELLFTLQVPVEWNVISYKLNNAGVYQTDLVENNVFYIKTYTASSSKEQAYRDQFRNWSPSPTETTVTINEITYDRFESTSDGNTSVAYVAHKSSTNERGYASVIVFVADTTNRFEKEDFEKIVTSFRYFSGNNASSLPGEEITWTNRPSSAGSFSGACHCSG